MNTPTESKHNPIKEACLKFFYWWWNAKGQNTEQGYDEWAETKDGKACIALIAHAPETAAELLRVQQELETERMRLAACGVVAGSNTGDSAAINRQMNNEYRSGSLEEVCRAVDREMDLRDDLIRLQGELAEVKEKLHKTEGALLKEWREKDHYKALCEELRTELYTREEMQEAHGTGCSYASAYEHGYPQEADSFRNYIKRLDADKAAALSKSQDTK
jgi:hypothetical protein